MTTAWYVVRRLALLAVSLIASSALVFLLLRLLPGDLAQAKLGIYGTPEALAQLRAEYGLDKSLPEQYLSWLSKAVRGDLGLSVLTGADITGELLSKATVTLPLIGIASVLAVLIAVPLGMLAALRFRKWDGIATSAVSQLGIAVPTFWIGVILITIFAVQTQVFPSGGFPYDGWADFGGAVQSLILPACTLALAQGAVLMRFARSATIDVIQQDYFRTARATGLSRSAALRVHGVRNALVPVVSVLGMQISTLIVGAIIVESVFALPGVGQMLLQDVNVRDYTKVQGTVAVTTALVFVVSFVIDLVLGWLNPRMRQR
ncbi:MAG: ABC-type dipeptide/oligopeptide/nickel transport system, permease component [Actinomycetota bacterium]|jgi:peptide/nickel transport system permease protein|nr:ABC transporter permease [Actinomycetota bacterium]